MECPLHVICGMHVQDCRNRVLVKEIGQKYDKKQIVETTIGQNDVSDVHEVSLQNILK